MGNYAQLIQKITQLREASGLTQEQVASKLDLSRQRWIMVEKGERDLSSQELGKLADVFGIDLVDFFETTPNIEKFTQLFLACLKYGADEKRKSIPKTKLAKLMYLADFTWYYNKLESMSGVKYRRMTYGPVADYFFVLTDELYASGKINIEPLSEGALMITSKTREANFDKLSTDELATVEAICDAWRTKSTREIVNFTHEQLPWKLCRDGEFIPYSLITQEDPDHVFQPD